jgi:hypothetical protein
MADPMSTISDPGTGTAISGTDPTASSSSLSSDLSSLSSGLSSFLTSPAGSLAEFGTIAGLGLSQANSQAKTNTQLASTLSSAGAPYTAAGQAELSQITGGPQMGGPLGASISQQTTAAANLGKVATDNSTGQLNAAQQQQVQQYIQQQRAMVDSQLASSGNVDSSARDAAYQQIDNNAAQLGQQLIQGNTTLATQALTAVQSTYSTLLNQSLSDASFGFGAQSAAVQTEIASNTQLSASLNALFGALAQGFGTAIGGNKSGGTGTTPAPGAGGTAATSAVKAATGVASSAAGGGTGTGTAGVGNSNPGSAPDLSTTDFSAGQIFGNTTPGFDVTAQSGTSGITPAFDTGFMTQQDLGTDPFTSAFDATSSSNIWSDPFTTS